MVCFAVQDPQKIWSTTLAEIELHVSAANYNTWVRPCRLLSTEEGLWKIGVPNGFAKVRIETKYQPLIEKILSQHVGGPVRVVCDIFSPQTQTKAPTGGLFAGGAPMDGIQAPPGYRIADDLLPLSSTPESQHVGIDTGIRLNPRFNFESFVVGSNNKLVNAAAHAVAEHPGEAYNPLFLYGDVGLGKTHLMHAIAQSVLTHHPGKKVLYVTSEKFTNELIMAIRNNRTEDFRQKYRGVDVLLIDDIQFIAGKETTQEEFFHTFNSIYEAGHQIVLSSDRPPKAIPTLEARLQSRFGAGLIADVQRPNYETRVAILEAKANARGIQLAPEVTAFIAEQVTSNIRDLEGSLNRIVTHCRVYDLPITRDVAANILAAYQETETEKRVTPKEITQAVASYYNIETVQLKGSSRKREIVMPRQIAMFLMRDKSKASLNQIGEEFGGRDHTTVLHACQKIEALIKTDEALKRDVEIIEQRLYT